MRWAKIDPHCLKNVPGCKAKVCAYDLHLKCRENDLVYGPRFLIKKQRAAAIVQCIRPVLNQAAILRDWSGDCYGHPVNKAAFHKVSRLDLSSSDKQALQDFHPKCPWKSINLFFCVLCKDIVIGVRLWIVLIHCPDLKFNHFKVTGCLTSILLFPWESRVRSLDLKQGFPLVCLNLMISKCVAQFPQCMFYNVI